MVKKTKTGESITPQSKLVEVVELVDSWIVGDENFPKSSHKIILINGLTLVKISRKFEWIDGGPTELDEAEIVGLKPLEAVTDVETLSQAEVFMRILSDESLDD